jgi:HEAT repeat protein
MNIEIVWLAYNKELVEEAWNGMTVKELYQYVLNDRFRKRVDPRSMLFHSKQSDLLEYLEELIKHGAINMTVEEYLSKLFFHGEDQFPLECGELGFDMGLIGYFTSLRMADDYQMVERFFDRLFKKMGVLKQESNFSFFELKNLDSFAIQLSEVKVKDIVELVSDNKDLDKGSDTYVKLVQNYVEFFNYYKNNGLEPFYYNSETDLKKWGNLIDRQNERSARIVNLAYTKVKQTLGKAKSKREMNEEIEDRSLISKFKYKRRIETLIAGLSDPDALIRQKAAEYLGSFGRSEDIEPLIMALNDSESEVRREAARALGEIGDKKAVKALVEKMLGDDSRSVVTSCAQALTNIGDSKAVASMVEAMAKGNFQLAVPIAFYPSIMKNREALTAIIKAARDKNVNLRRQIAFILGEIKTKESVKELVGRLSDEDRDVKINAIYSLGRIASKEALNTLKEFAAKSNDEEIKKSSMRALSLPQTIH